MPWEKGKPPVNPGGLTTRQMGIRRRLEGLTVKAVAALERVLDDDAATHGERLAAAREVFDRAIGKPKQQATLEVTHNASPHLTALVGLAAATVARVQSVPVIDGQLIDIAGYNTIVHQSEPIDVDVDVGQSDDD